MTEYGQSAPVTLRPFQVEAKKLTIALTVLLSLSVGLNVLLAHKVRTLTADLSPKTSDRRLQAGALVPTISAQRLYRGKELISYERTNRPTILYVFTPSCIWCARNLENLKTLVTKKNSEYRVIGLSLSDNGLAEYVSKNSLEIPVYSGLLPETLTAYKLGNTPQTVVVSPEGRVLKNWVGVWVGKQEQDIEHFFDLKLPGLTDVPPEAAKTN